MKWAEIIELPSVNVIMGFRRRGKSGLGFYLTEELGTHYGLKKVVFGFPPQEKHLLPEEYILTADVEIIPPKSIVLIDEVFLFAHSRRSMKKANLLFDRLTAMSGKQKQIIIYITHHSRKMDRNLILDTDNLIYKKPSKLQIEMERPEIRPFSRKAYEQLKNKGKQWSYVFSFVKDLEVLISNPLPSFWTEEISNVTYIDLEEAMKTKEEEEDGEKLVNDLHVDYGINEEELFSLPPIKRAEIIFSLPKNSLKRRILFNKHLELSNEGK